MRSSRSFALLNSSAWSFDFRRNNRVELPREFIELFYDSPQIFQPWKDFDNWRLWHKKVLYKDYSDEKNVLAEDQRENELKHAEKDQPPLLNERLLALAKRVRKLPEPLSREEHTDSALSNVLFFAFGAVELRKFHSDIVQLKNVPSVGCRHGIDVVYCEDGSVFYYSSLEHELLEIEAPDLLIPGTNTLRIFFRPSVYMWRYETSACLIDVYFDLGHVLSVLGFATHLYGVSLSELRTKVSPGAIDLDFIELVSFEIVLQQSGRECFKNHSGYVCVNR